MFTTYRSRNLKEGEVLLREVRPYPLSMAGRWILAALFLFAPFFFLFPLLQLGPWGAAILLVSFAIGIILTLRAAVLYFLNVLLITNQRLIDIDQRGFFEQIVSETTYDKIQDVSFAIKGIRQTLFRYGTVTIQTAGSQANIEIRNTRNPEDVHTLILKNLGDAIRHQPTAAADEEHTPEEFLKLLRRLRQIMGDKDFRDLVRKVEKE